MFSFSKYGSAFFCQKERLSLNINDRKAYGKSIPYRNDSGKQIKRAGTVFYAIPAHFSVKFPVITNMLTALHQYAEVYP